MPKPQSATKIIPDASIIRDAVDYDPQTGLFVWSRSRPGYAVKGRSAGRKHPDGYWRINIFRKEYLAHRLAWLLVYGDWPTSQIDHINGIRCDNRITNLRQASQCENARNTALYRNNKSGFKGVSARRGRWIAQIQCGKRKIHIGAFDNKQAAHRAYQEEAKKLFGEFARQ